MKSLKTIAFLPAQHAMMQGTRLLNKLEAEGADFVRVDSAHAYLWHNEELVNLYDHQDLIRFLEKHGFMRTRAENKMIITAWVIFEGLKRCE